MKGAFLPLVCLACQIAAVSAVEAERRLADLSNPLDYDADKNCMISSDELVATVAANPAAEALAGTFGGAAMIFSLLAGGASEITVKMIRDSPTASSLLTVMDATDKGSAADCNEDGTKKGAVAGPAGASGDYGTMVVIAAPAPPPPPFPYMGGEKLSVGILSPIVEDYRYLAAIAAIDIDFRAQFDTSLQARGFKSSQPIDNMHADLRVRPLAGDTGGFSITGMQQAVKFIFGKVSNLPVPESYVANGLIGPVSNYVAFAITSFTSAHNVPQILTGAQDDTFSDKQRYPYTFRVGPKAARSTEAMWAYFRYYKAKACTLLYTSEPFGDASKNAIVDGSIAAGLRKALIVIPLPYAVPPRVRDVDTALNTALVAKTRFIMTIFISTMAPDLYKGMIAVELCQPKFQLLGSIQTSLVDITGLEHHHFVTPVIKEDAITNQFWDNWKLMKAADVKAQETRFDVVSWSTTKNQSLKRPYVAGNWIAYDSSRLNDEMFADRVHGEEANIILYMWNSYRAYLQAFNTMLHAGVQPSDIKGKKLQEALQQVNIDGVGFPVQFDEKNDMKDFDMHISDFLRYDPVTTRPVLNKFLRYQEATKTMIPMGIGPTWADGTTSVKPPTFFFECFPGRKLVTSENGGYCVPCDPGTVSLNYSVTKCTACPPGKSTMAYPEDMMDVVDTIAPKSLIAADTFCTHCPTGYMNGVAGATACEGCGPGKFTTKPGDILCERCEPGSYADQNLNSGCKDCPGQLSTLYTATMSEAECACGGGFYPQDPDVRDEYSVCLPCPDAFSCQGGNDIDDNGTEVPRLPILSIGHYATAEEPYKAYKCNKAKDLCLGLRPENCGGGRYGLQCSQCKLGQTTGDGGECEDCQGGGFAMYPCFLVGGLLGMGTIHRLTSGTKSSAFTQMPLFSVAGQIVAQVQILALMGSYKINYPKVLINMFGFLKIFVFDMGALSISCYFGSGLASQYVPGVALPIAIILAMMLLWLVTKILRVFLGANFHGLDIGMDMNNIVNTLGMVLSALSVAVFKSVITVIECKENPSAEQTLKNFDGYYCGGDDVTALMPLIGLSAFVFVFGGGSVYGYVVLQGPKKFHTSKFFRQRFRFVLNRWHPTYYWWGALQVFKNLCMCLVPTLPVNGLVQMVLLILIFAPLFFATLTVSPWRDVMANYNDFILSSMFVLIMFLTAFLVDRPEPDVRITIGWCVVTACCIALFVIVMITTDMVFIILRGRPFFITNPQVPPKFVDTFVETMSKWAMLGAQGRKGLDDDARRFISQMPQVDVRRLMWVTNLMQTGMFAETPMKRISGISPVAPRHEDDRIQAMRLTEEGKTIPQSKTDHVWV